VKSLGIEYHIISQKGTLEEATEGYNRVMEGLFASCDYKMAVMGIGTDGIRRGCCPGMKINGMLFTGSCRLGIQIHLQFAREKS